MRLLLILLLAGCSYSPKEVMEEGPKSVHQVQSAPELAARCIGRNVEVKLQALIQSADRALDPGPGRELIFRLSNPPLFATIARVEPAGSGSAVTVWLTPNPILGKSDWPKLMIDGC